MRTKKHVLVQDIPRCLALHLIAKFARFYAAKEHSARVNASNVYAVI